MVLSRLRGRDLGAGEATMEIAMKKLVVLTGLLAVGLFSASGAYAHDHSSGGFKLTVNVNGNDNGNHNRGNQSANGAGSGYGNSTTIIQQNSGLNQNAGGGGY